MAALTSSQVLQLVDQAGRSGVPALVWLMRESAKTPTGGSSLTATQSALIDAVQAMPAEPPAAPYVHPAATATIARLARDRDPMTGQAKPRPPLTAAEVAWLQRLPSDPAQISFGDAVTLMQLLHDVVDPAEAPLVRSIAQPVRDYHDRQQARVDLEAAQRPRPQIPPAALGALADAVAAEHPELQPQEAIGRASTMLAERAQQRSDEQDQQAWQAQQRIAKIDTDARDRAAAHRGPTPDALVAAEAS